MNVARAGLPVTPGVFAGCVSLVAARTDYRLIAEQVADAAGMRVFAARTVMAARELYRFPASAAPKLAQQIAQQGRLAHVG
jgi:hypothetical protein